MAMAGTTYPVQIDLDSPLEITRWRVFQGILAVPHIIVMYGLLIAYFLAQVAAWFVILFTGKMPEGIFNFMVMVQRYQWRVATYTTFMREPYPPFDFTTSPTDPGGDPATLSAQYPEKWSRLLLFVRFFMAIPHFIALIVMGIGAYIAIVIGFFAVLFTGKWPEGLRNYVLGVMRWGYRVSAFIGLLTDVYPPFSTAP